MLSDREKKLFDDLERQFYLDSSHREESRTADGRDSPRGWVLEAALGVSVAMIAICGILDSPGA